MGRGRRTNYYAIMGPDGKPLGGRNNPLAAPMPAIAPAPPPQQPAPQSRGDDDPSHVHVHLHQDGRVRAVRAQSGTGVRITLNTGRTFPQFG